MRSILSLIFALAAAGPACGQLISNTISVTATRQIAVAPDQTTVAIYVDAGLDQDLEDVLRSLAPIGITKANFADFSTTYGAGSVPMWEWLFTITVPISKLSNLAVQLEKFQSPSGLSLSFYLENTAPSVSCDYTKLIADAQTKASSLAAVAGVRAGQIVALSDAAYGPLVGAQRSQQFALVDAKVLLTGLLTPFLPILANNYTCSLTVQFQLLQNQ